MKRVSEEYRNEMKFPFRNRWLLSMVIGLIDEELQSKASFYSHSPLSFLSTRDGLFDGISVDKTFATFEENMFKADGSSLFCSNYPSQEGSNIYYQGLVTDDTSDAYGDIWSMVSVDFRDIAPRRSQGLTLYFEGSHPTSVTVEVYDAKYSRVFSKEYPVTSNKFETRDLFSENAARLDIIVNHLDKPHTRFRLRYMMFGVGESFTNDSFLSSMGSFKETFNSRSLELPTKEFSITIDNYDEKFDIEDPDSIINMATIGQDVSVNISYQYDDGRIESVRDEKLELASFDVNNKGVSVKAVDFLRNENTEIEITNDMVLGGMQSLYDIASFIIKSIHNTTFKVELDDALKETMVAPVDFHYKGSCKQALMMVANAGRCIMELDGKTLRIRRTIRDTDLSNLRVESDTMAPYANPSTILNFNTVCDIASFEPDLVKADGSSLISSESMINNVKTGFISSDITNDEGVFDNPQILHIYSNEKVSSDYMILKFSNVSPKKITIKVWNDSDLVDTIEYNVLFDGSKTDKVIIDKRIETSNHLEITIYSLFEPNRRAVIDYVSFDRDIYPLTDELCLEYPKTEIHDTVKNLLIGQPGKTEQPPIITIACNEIGSDFEYNNAFINNEYFAPNVAVWLGEYYISQIHYKIDTVGDPSLVANDIVKIPNKFNPELLGVIEENEIIFQNGGIREKMDIKKENYATPTSVAEWRLI